MLNNKYLKIFLITIVTISILAIFSLFTFHEEGIDLNSFIYGNLSDSHIIINNSKYSPDFVSTNGNYDFSHFFRSTWGLETKKNLMKTIEGNINYTFKTEYFLPMAWKNNGHSGTNEYWYNCQSIAIHGKYMYILTSSGYDLNKGFIVRYNMDILNKYNLSTSNLSLMRELGMDLENAGPLTKKQKAIKKAIKVGPVFNTGHGQSLSYNPKDNSMWMWQDDDSSNYPIRLMSIDMNDLKPNKTYYLSVSHNNRKIKEFRNLAFDNEGNFYTDYIVKSKSNPNGSSVIFKGKVLNNVSLEIEHLGTIKNRPGTYSQSLSINPITNRMYLVSDGVFYTMPLDKLNNKTLVEADFHYSVFDTNREFEGISFDDAGNSYLLVLRGTEVLKSSDVHY